MPRTNLVNMMTNFRIATINSSKAYAKMHRGDQPLKQPTLQNIDTWNQFIAIGADPSTNMLVLGRSQEVWNPQNIFRDKWSTQSVTSKQIDRSMKSVYVNPSYVQSTEGQKGIANLKRRADLDNKGKQYDAPFNLDRGSVLYNWAEWSLQGNDAFIAGGACERKAIQVLIPSTRYKDISTDVIWDAKQARPTVLGHELAFANLIGEYERKKPVDPREPLTLTPKNKEDTEEITPEKLSSAMDIIASITSEGELRALLESFDSPESNPQAPPVVLHIDTSKKEDN